MKTAYTSLGICPYCEKSEFIKQSSKKVILHFTKDFFFFALPKDPRWYFFLMECLSTSESVYRSLTTLAKDLGRKKEACKQIDS